MKLSIIGAAIPLTMSAMLLLLLPTSVVGYCHTHVWWYELPGDNHDSYKFKNFNEGDTLCDSPAAGGNCNMNKNDWTGCECDANSKNKCKTRFERWPPGAETGTFFGPKLCDKIQEQTATDCAKGNFQPCSSNYIFFPGNNTLCDTYTSGGHPILDDQGRPIGKCVGPCNEATSGTAEEAEEGRGRQRDGEGDGGGDDRRNLRLSDREWSFPFAFPGC